MNVAIYDATITAWNTKYTYMRPRPSETDSSLNTIIPTPHRPAYPAEHAVAAGAASVVLARLFPDKADFFTAQAESAVNAMLHSGIYYPSDIEAGFALGQEVGARSVAWADANPLNLTPVEEINGGEGKWYGTNPILPHTNTQYDPNFQTVFPTPNHPSYPSAHSVISMAMMATLAELFPEDVEYLIGMSQQGGEARLWGDIHFRHEVIVGEEMGRRIAEKVLASFEIMN